MSVKYEVLALYYSSAGVVEVAVVDPFDQCGRRRCAIRRRFEVSMVFKGVSDDDLVNDCGWRKTGGRACGLRRSRWADQRSAWAMLLLLLL